MSRYAATRLCTLLLLLLLATRASAHAPLARAVATTPDGAGIALALPGFGLLVRPDAQRPFRYVCDALNDVPTSDLPPALAYFADGTLLLGSLGGLRTLAADGCPLPVAASPLRAAPVVALAIQSEAQVAYVLATGRERGLWRSVDRGQTWQYAGDVAHADDVTGLAIAPDTSDTLYLTIGNTLLVSRDAGASFEEHTLERPVRVLGVHARTHELWGVAPALQRVGNREFDIMHAAGPQAAWQEALRVHFFGGLTIDAAGTLWAGDEGGGVYRSLDDGAHFEQVLERNAVACLASAAETVLACTPALPTMPALNALPLTDLQLQPVVTLSEVDRLAECDAQTQCAAAWVEWQRDVLLRDPALIATASEAPNALPNDAGQSAVPDAAEQDPAPTSHPSGCVAIPNPRSASPWGLAPTCLVLLALARRRRTDS